MPDRLPIRKIHLAPQTGTSFVLKRGELLRVIDVEGVQVSDLIAFNAADKREWLSSGRSLDYANTIYLTTGHTLYSNRSTPMLKITTDTVGRHDFLYTPCSPETFKIIYNDPDGDSHPSCFMNLVNARPRVRHRPRRYSHDVQHLHEYRHPSQRRAWI